MSLDLDKTGWKRVALGDVATASKEKWDQASHPVERYIAGEHMDTDDLKIHRWGQVGDGYLGPAFHRRFRPGQVLYGSRRTYLRKVAVADFDGVCANTTFVIDPVDETVLLRAFLPWVMTSEPFHAFAIAESKGSVNPYVNWSDIAQFELDLPPLDQQQRIADLLWTIEQHRRLLVDTERKSRIARSCFVDREVDRLVTGDEAPFSSTWSRSPESGWSAAPVDETTGRYVLSLAALGPEGYRCGELKSVADTPEVRATVLAHGDFLISRANTVDTVGRVGIYSEDRDDVSFPDTMMRLDFQPRFDPRFVEVVLSSGHGRAHMRRTAAGSATSMVKINRKSLGALRFPVATGHEQRQLLDAVGVFRRAESEIRAELDTVTVLTKGVSAEIFGGAG